MSFRVSFILLVLVAIVAGYVAFFELQQAPEAQTQAPWFYNVGFDEIDGIAVEHLGERQAFVFRNNAWVFEDTGELVDQQKWSGVPFLLAGPRSSRIALEKVDNPAEFGLEPPRTKLTLALEGGREVSVILGNATPDGTSHYGQLVGDETLFLITSSWGNIINQLVTEPPLPDSTPVPRSETDA